MNNKNTVIRLAASVMHTEGGCLRVETEKKRGELRVREKRYNLEEWGLEEKTLDAYMPQANSNKSCKYRCLRPRKSSSLKMEGWKSHVKSGSV